MHATADTPLVRKKRCRWAKLSELRQHVDLFRQSGKFSIAYMSAGGEKECVPLGNLIFVLLLVMLLVPVLKGSSHLQKSLINPTVQHSPSNGRDASPIQLLAYSCKDSICCRYFLASSFEEIYLAPAASFALRGISLAGASCHTFNCIKTGTSFIGCRV